MVNLTEVRNQTSIRETFCSQCLTGIQLRILLSVLNTMLSITAFLGNAVIIVALRKVRSLHPPSKLLLTCLASADLCVGIITRPIYVVLVLTSENSRRYIYVRSIYNITSFIFGGVSLATVTAISTDRLFALMLGLRYRQVLTLRRVRVLVAIFWPLSVAISMIFLYSFRIAIMIIFILLLLCVAISTFCYSKIYWTLRQKRIQVQTHGNQGQPNGGVIPLNIARFKKSVSTALWVQMTILACYLPYGIIVAVFSITGERTSSLIKVWAVSLSLLHLNSSLNPFLYCWKIRGVRKAVKETIRQLCYFSG